MKYWYVKYNGEIRIAIGVDGSEATVYAFGQLYRRAEIKLIGYIHPKDVHYDDKRELIENPNGWESLPLLESYV